MEKFHCNVVKKDIRLMWLLQANLYIGFIALAASFFVEYGLLKPPCIFCIYERFPYGALILFALVGMACIRNVRVVLGALIGCAISYFVGAGITLYHVLIEHHIVALPKVCGGGKFFSSSDLEGLKAEILSTRIVPCDQVPFKILGFSLAEINFVFSVIVGLILSAMLYKVWKSMVRR